MEREFILESKVFELESEVNKLKLENAKLKCLLIDLATEKGVKLSFDIDARLKQPSSSLRIDESES